MYWLWLLWRDTHELEYRLVFLRLRRARKGACAALRDDVAVICLFGRRPLDTPRGVPQARAEIQYILLIVIKDY